MKTIFVFNWLDYLLIGFFIFGAVLGILQGYRWQLFRIGCLILAFFLVLVFSNTVNNLLSKFFKIENVNYIGYASIFFGTLLITFFIGILITKTKVSNPDGSKIAGALLGVVKNGIFCSIIITCLWLSGTERERKPINNSIISTKLRTGALFAIYKLPQSFLKSLNKTG